MKTKNIIALAILLAVVFSSCQTNNPENNLDQNIKTNIPGLVIKEHVSIMDWLANKDEATIYYSFVDYPSGMCTKGIYNQFQEAKTIMFNERLGIRMHDSCAIDNSQGKTICHVMRKCEVVDKEREESLDPQIFRMPKGTKQNEYFSFDFTISEVSPIYIQNPKPTPCNPIPMCYYHQMDIMWNPDSNNPTRMMIVTEWNGLNMDGASADTTIIHHLETKDDGIVTLDDDIFNGMPDGALVNIWLVRENIVMIHLEGEEKTWEEIIKRIEYKPEDLYTFTHNNPEYTYSYPVYYEFGAIAHLPIFLIKETREPVPDRVEPVYD